MKVNAEGQVGDLPLKLDGTFGSYRAAGESGEPFPAKGTLTLGKSKIALNGTIARSGQPAGHRSRTDMRAEDLTQALALFGPSGARDPAFRPGGAPDPQGRRDSPGGSHRQGRGQLGQGLDGVRLGGERPKVSGDLLSERFDLDDLAGLIGRPPAAGPGETASPRQEKKEEAVKESPYVIPDAKLNAERWQALDLDVHFRGQRVTAGKLPLEAVEFRIVMDNRPAADRSAQGDGRRLAGGRLRRGRLHHQAAAGEVDVAANGMELSGSWASSACPSTAAAACRRGWP